MPIQKDIFIDNYLQALNNGDAAIFAGAGLSVPSGCVNWKQLLNGIAAELALDIEKESDLVAIAQYHYNKSGNNRTKLNEIIRDAFQTGKSSLMKIITYSLIYQFLHIGQQTMTS